MKKLVAISAVAIVCLTTLTGCWDRHEVKDLALVMASGIDRNDLGQMSMTIQIAVPAAIGAHGGGAGSASSGEGMGKSYLLVTEKGRNVSDIVQKLQERVPRYLCFSHRVVLIIGEKQARNGIKDLLDQFARSPTTRLRTLILVAKGEKARDLMSISTVLEKIPGQEIKQIELQETGGLGTLMDFYIAAASDGIVPIAPAMQLITDKREKKGGQKLVSAGTAIFKDLKLAGYLNVKETRGLLWLTGRMHKAYFTAYVPEAKGYVTIDIAHASSVMKPVYRNHRFTFYVTLKGKGMVRENDTNLNLSDHKNMELVKHALDNDTRKSCLKSFKTAQAYGADVFGFGQEVCRKNPRKWDQIKANWDTIFKKSELIVHADIEPLRAGVNGAPLQIKEDEVR